MTALVFRAVVFDLDGTLLVPRIDFKNLRRKLGVPEGESLLDFVESKRSPEMDSLRKILVDEEKRAARLSTLMPGARETLAWLSEAGIRLGVLTRNSRDSWEEAWRRCRLDEIQNVVTREDAPIKPDPRALEPFFREWGVRPSEVVHIGDYLYDLQIAHAAGTHSILLNSGGDNPYEVPCDRVARNHAELLEILRSMPFEV